MVQVNARDGEQQEEEIEEALVGGEEKKQLGAAVTADAYADADAGAPSSSTPTRRKATPSTSTTTTSSTSRNKTSTSSSNTRIRTSSRNRNNSRSSSRSSSRSRSKSSTNTERNTSTPSIRSTSSSISAKTKHGSYVFVRVRPLLSQIGNSINKINISNDEDRGKDKDEVEEGILKDLTTDTNIPINVNINDAKSSKSNDYGVGAGVGVGVGVGANLGVTAMGGPLPITGFNGIFGMTSTNSFVFRQSFLPRIDTIMNGGGTSSFFCYGYTGAGKTFTTLGSDGDDGNFSGDDNGNGSGSDNDTCNANENSYGVFRLAAEELFQRVCAYNKEQESTNEAATSTNANTEPYFIIASAIEVYNDDVYDLLGQKAKCTLRKNKKGQLLVRGATEKRFFTAQEAETKGIDYSIVTKTLSSVPITSIQDLDTIQQTALQYRKVGSSTTHCQSSRSHAIFRLDIVNQTLMDAVQELEEAEQIKPAVQTAYDKKRTYQLRHWVLDIEKKIDEMSQLIDEMYVTGARKNSPFGGRMILVDLAGADSDHRSIGEGGQTAAQRKESTAINKSLMALKECICGLSSSKPIKAVTFRNSSLTRLLEEVLTPKEKRNSDSVMVVNIGPEGNLKSKTMNSLRYGSMYSSLKQKKPVRGITGLRATNNRAQPSPHSSSRRGSLREAKMRMKKEMQQKKEMEEIE